MQKFTQLIAEAILPILGFYYWDWSWYFILLFYILDVFAKEVILNLQADKIYETQGGTETLATWKRSAIKSALIGLIILILLHLMQYLRNPKFAFSQEWVDFFYHKEMGIPQGFILIPLIFLNVWMQYKMNFLKLNLHFKYKMSQMWAEHIHYRFFVLSIVALGIGATKVIGLNEAILLWSAVLMPFIYLQFFKKST